MGLKWDRKTRPTRARQGISMNFALSICKRLPMRHQFSNRRNGGAAVRFCSLPYRGTTLTALLLLGFAAVAPPALAAGGVVKLKTDGGPDGYYYNVLGIDGGRYCSLYRPEDFDPQALICGARIRAVDQSQITPGFDVYSLPVDLRQSDPNCPGYADLRNVGLIALADTMSIGTCSRTGEPRTVTFGGGGGVPDPLNDFVLTAIQPANRNPLDPTDFCGLLLDTSSRYVGSARFQGVQVGGPKGTIGENHFLEAFVFEPKRFDANFRMSGSARFNGDPGIRVMFARRECDRLRTNCRVDNSDVSGGTVVTDDFITAHITIDNNSNSQAVFNLNLIADRTPLNPMLGSIDATNFFRPLGGGPPLMNPIVFPPARSIFSLEIPVAIKRKFVQRFPVNLPFELRLADPNDPLALADSEVDVLGLRPFAGFYDDGTAEVFVVPRVPVMTGDAVATRYAALDLPKPGSTLRIDGVQIVGGEFGGVNLPGLPFIELRTEDPVLTMNPDLSPQGLLRLAVGPFPFGPPPTTVDIDITDVISDPPSAAFAPNVWLLAYLNPGDIPSGANRGGGMTAIGGDTTEETDVEEESFTKPGDGGMPVDADCDTNYMMRADTDPPTGFPFTGPRRGNSKRQFLVKPRNRYVPYPEGAQSQ